ncbi:MULTISPECIES: aldo/keto reductase [unclassified Microbacterium]|uniref:aldo/keto reductase n=1 Tax=unclassified Microbacterium TaxID=2609290 RepID=UPI00257C7207|nr:MULTISPECIES: aldo/keto reductase [unclassified Microbacterium]
MRTALIGDREVTRLGFGGWQLSGVEPRPAQVTARHVIETVFDAGITLIDTADSYQLGGEEPGHNERLLSETVASWKGQADALLIASKGGRSVTETGERYCNASPSALRAACEGSLRRLGTDHIELYYLHRPDPAVPFEDSLGCLSDLAEEGSIRSIGVSNVDEAQLHTAHALLGPRLVAVQNEFSPWNVESEPVVRLAEQLGLAFIGYAPFGGVDRSGQLGSSSDLANVARRYDATPHELTLAWILAQSPAMFTIPATRTAGRVASLVNGASLDLSTNDVRELSDIFAGLRNA